jgi:hypothetical protein
MEVIATNLKPVFDACDENGDGFVNTHDLIQYSGLAGEGHSNEVRECYFDSLWTILTTASPSLGFLVIIVFK